MEPKGTASNMSDSQDSRDVSDSEDMDGSTHDTEITTEMKPPVSQKARPSYAVSPSRREKQSPPLSLLPPTPPMPEVGGRGSHGVDPANPSLGLSHYQHHHPIPPSPGAANGGDETKRNENGNRSRRSSFLRHAGEDRGTAAAEADVTYPRHRHSISSRRPSVMGDVAVGGSEVGSKRQSFLTRANVSANGVVHATRAAVSAVETPSEAVARKAPVGTALAAEVACNNSEEESSTRLPRKARAKAWAFTW